MERRLRLLDHVYRKNVRGVFLSHLKDSRRVEGKIISAEETDGDELKYIVFFPGEENYFFYYASELVLCNNAADTIFSSSPGVWFVLLDRCASAAPFPTQRAVGQRGQLHSGCMRVLFLRGRSSSRIRVVGVFCGTISCSTNSPFSRRIAHGVGRAPARCTRHSFVCFAIPSLTRSAAFCGRRFWASAAVMK